MWSAQGPSWQRRARWACRCVFLKSFLPVSATGNLRLLGGIHFQADAQWGLNTFPKEVALFVLIFHAIYFYNIISTSPVLPGPPHQPTFMFSLFQAK